MTKHEGKSIGRKKFRTIALPKSLIDRIVELVGDEENGHGYATVPEFVKEAIRMRLEELELKDLELKRIKEQLSKE